MALVNNKLTVSVVISAGGTLSTEGDMAPFLLCGIVADAHWTPATVALQTSIDGVDFLPVQGASGALSLGTLATSSVMVLDPSQFRALNSIKVVSAVDQTNATTLTLLGATIS